VLLAFAAKPPSRSTPSLSTLDATARVRAHPKSCGRARHKHNETHDHVLVLSVDGEDRRAHGGSGSGEARAGRGEGEPLSFPRLSFQRECASWQISTTALDSITGIDTFIPNTSGFLWRLHLYFRTNPDHFKRTSSVRISFGGGRPTTGISVYSELIPRFYEHLWIPLESTRMYFQLE
jgi:hypothetical protein